jgi:O-antigen/teichoic acid export membrane protein
VSAGPGAPAARGAAQRLVRDYAVLTAGELFAKVAGFLGFAWLARALGPEAYGAVELAAALVMVFGLVVDFGLGPIAAREVTRDPARAAELARRIPALRLVLCAPAVLAMLATVLVLDLAPGARALGALYAVSPLAGPWTLNWLFQGLDRVRWVALASALRMTVFAGGAVLLVKGPAQLWGVGAVELAAALGAALYYAATARVAARVPLRPALDRAQAGALLAEAWPVGVSQILWILNQYLPTLLLAALAGAAPVAFYGGAHRIVMALATFVYLYFFTLYPSLVRATQMREGDFAGLARQSFRATAWLGVAAGLAGTLVAVPAVRLAYGDAFAAAATPFAVLAWVLPVSLLSGHARYALIAAGRQRLELVAQAAGIAASVGLGVPLVAWGGPLGAALAMLGAGLVVWGVAHRFTVRHVGALPALAPLARPALAAAVAAAVAHAAAGAPGGAWTGAAAALSAYAALALLFDRRLLRDLHGLARGVRGADGAVRSDPELRYTEARDGRKAKACEAGERIT